jgi:hypothetical protein
LLRHIRTLTKVSKAHGAQITLNKAITHPRELGRCDIVFLAIAALASIYGLFMSSAIVDIPAVRSHSFLPG